jgi:hypothetical protein
MRKLLTPLALALVTVLAITSPAVAGVVNGGFETGDFTGWGTIGATAVVGTGCSTIFPNHCASPTQGNYMALLEAGYVDMGTLSAILGTDLTAVYPGGTYGSAIWQDVHLHAGNVFSFDWNFLGNDYNPFDDTGAFTAYVFTTTANGSFYLSSVLAVGDYGTSGWQHWSGVATTNSTYRVGFVVFNDLDNVLNSQLLVDNVQATPEPGTLVLLGSGILGLGGLVRRKLNL